MDKWIFDVESFPNYFCVTFEEYNTKEKYFFEISDFKNQTDELIDFIMINCYNSFMVSFNGCDYDTPMLLYILDLRPNTKNIKMFSDYIINNDYWWGEPGFKKYKYHYKWIDVDLFLYWAKKTRIDRKISLKGLAVTLKYEVIQELPFPPDHIIKDEDRDIIKNYNSKHDISILRRIVEEKEDEIKLRVFLKNKYSLNCMSYDTIKIASEYLLQSYCNTTNKNRYDVKNTRFTQNGIPDMSDVNLKFEIKKHQELFDIAGKTGSLEAQFLLNDLKISMGSGGIHSVNNYEEYYANDEYYLITSDVASLYPQLIENYNLLRFPEIQTLYSNTKKLRLEAKKEGRKTEDAFYKLLLNGVSGLLDQAESWLYYPENALKMRFVGQFTILKLCELCSLNNFKVVSANTDGIEVLVKKSRLAEYYSLVEEVENAINLKFEHEFYKSIHYMNVSNYFAVYMDEKKPYKRKGFFLTNPPMEYNIDFSVIPKAVEDKLVKNIHLEYSVRNNKDIFDFCASQKVSKSHHVWHNNKEQQRLNRYYASNGPYLYKNKDGKISHMLKSSGVTIYNEHNPDVFPKDINYTFYVNKCKEIINNFRNKQLSMDLLC